MRVWVHCEQTVSALPPGKRAGQRHSMSTHIMRDPLQSAFLEHAPNVGGLNCAPRGVGSNSAVDTEPPRNQGLTLVHFSPQLEL